MTKPPSPESGEDAAGQDQGAGIRRPLHARRQGRRPRAQRQRLFDELLPRLQPSLEAFAEPGRLFDPAPRALRLEIGFGGGEHLLAQAAAHPGTGFIGCEPFLEGVGKALSGIAAARLSNVRIWTGDARDVLDALPDGALARIDILFPDPWPKKRHHKRRFIGPETCSRLARVLAPGGVLVFATDWADYARWTLVHLARDPRFTWTARRPRDWRTAPAGHVETRYEAKGRAAGRAITWLIFERR